MDGDRTPENLSLGTAALVVSPVAVIVGVLMAMIAGHDFLRSTGELPIALGLSAPAIFLALRRAVPALLPSRPTRQAGAPLLAGHARRLDHAP